MSEVKLSINTKDLQRIEGKLRALHKRLQSKEGPVFQFMLKGVLTPYQEAIISGIGTVPVGDILDTEDRTADLRSFMGTSVQVRWKPLAPRTLLKKKAEGWSMTIWMASGATKNAIKVRVKEYKLTTSGFAGIDKSNPELLKRAIDNEFSHGGGRALFTLLNTEFRKHLPDIKNAVREAIRDTIREVGWGK